MFDQNTKLGVLKGGQLGRMLTQSCMDFGIPTYVMDNDQNAPCRNYCTEFTVGDVMNFDDVYRFGKKVDVLTLEFEHINVDALLQLQKEGLIVHPDPRIVQMVQDKGAQKEFYRKSGIPTADFVLVDDASQIPSLIKRFPMIQKSRTAGYDGKGVYKIKSAADIAAALKGPSLLEEYVEAAKEISVIVARSASGEMVTYPIVEMEMQPQANLLEYLLAPARISDKTAQRAVEIAHHLASALKIVGILAVEMFVTKTDEVLVNEIAPRPHNSAHHTIEANVTSQFEQHLRAIMDWPLGSTQMISPSVMVNITGEPGHRGPARYVGIEDVLKKSNTHIHLYAKNETAPFRKMGHITVLADDLQKAKEEAVWIKNKVKVVA